MPARKNRPDKHRPALSREDLSALSRWFAHLDDMILFVSDAFVRYRDWAGFAAVDFASSTYRDLLGRGYLHVVASGRDQDGQQFQRVGLSEQGKKALGKARAWRGERT